MKKIAVTTLLLASALTPPFIRALAADSTCEQRVAYYRLCYEKDKDACEIHRPEKSCFEAGAPELSRPAKYPEPEALPSPITNIPDQKASLDQAEGVAQAGQRVVKSEQEKLDVAIEDAEKDGLSKTQEAEKILEEQKKAIAKEKSERIKREKIEKYERNRRAIQAMQKALKERKPPPQREIANVDEPAIRSKLNYASAAKNAADSYRKKRKSLGEKLKELVGLQEKIVAKKIALGALTNSKVTGVGKTRVRKEYVYVKENPGANALSAPAARSGEMPTTLDTPKMQLNSPGKPTEQWEAAIRQRLKKAVAESQADPNNEKLREEIASLKAALLSGGPPVNPVAKVATPATDVALDALESAEEKEEKSSARPKPWRHLSLRGAAGRAEVLAKIKELEAAGAMQAAADLRAGIMEEESATLFDRINEVVRECARRHCVLFRY